MSLVEPVATGGVRALSRTPGFEVALGRPLRIGLVNNMPDAALAATDAQFRRLLEAAVGPKGFDLRLFALTGAVRAPAMRRRMAATHGALEDLMASDLDGLIVTGAEPKAACIAHEPVYPEMAALAAHAKTRTVSTIWSCLAAHAAVFALTGASRRPLETKVSGVFPFLRTGAHPLTEGVHHPLSPHSRLNGLCEKELRAAGCAILTRSSDHGVDAFMLERGSLFVFLQGHPEYDPEALRLEWRRDIRRAATTGAAAPPPPRGYFSVEAEAMLRIGGQEGTSALLAASQSAQLKPPSWRPWAEQFWRNWCALLAVGSQPSQGRPRIRASNA